MLEVGLFKHTLFFTPATVHGCNSAFRVAAVCEVGEPEVFKVILEIVKFLSWLGEDQGMFVSNGTQTEKPSVLLY